MHWTVAFRHLLVRPWRSLVLLGGYAIGVGVMIVLLSVGDAMLVQSRDVSLVGGGDLIALPEGLDVEALRTGGMTGMFFGIDRARFVTRQLIGGPRHAAIVRAVLPILDGKRVELLVRDSTWVVRASGELPTFAEAAGSPFRVVAGRWGSGARDSAWAAPMRQQLYDELDHFHLPDGRDSSWGEWHYFNIEVSADEWWYVTFLVGGDVRGDRWGGQVLMTHRTPRGHRRYTDDVPAASVRFDTSRADVTLGASSVIQRDGRYRVRGSAGTASIDVEIVPAPRRYFPAVELRADSMPSGYVVPALAARATGRICQDGSCTTVVDVPAYHDHNWGTWRGVTWEWGTGRGRTHSILYGGIISDAAAGVAPFFMAIADSFGIRQVYRFDSVIASGARTLRGGVTSPTRLALLAKRGSDTVRLEVLISDAHATRSAVAGFDRTFLQMRGQWTLTGSAGGASVSDSGTGFFETWRNAPPAVTAIPPR